MAKAAYGRRYRAQRERMLLEQPWCVYCGGPATEADHQPPLSLHRHVAGTGCCTLLPSCTGCRKRQAGVLGGSRLRPRIY